jgi:hypothetical protein
MTTLDRMTNALSALIHLCARRVYSQLPLIGRFPRLLATSALIGGCRTNQTRCTNLTTPIFADLARAAQPAGAGSPRPKWFTRKSSPCGQRTRSRRPRRFVRQPPREPAATARPSRRPHRRLCVHWRAATAPARDEIGAEVRMRAAGAVRLPVVREGGTERQAQGRARPRERRRFRRGRGHPRRM